MITYIATRDANANTDMDAAMAHVGIYTGESFDDAAAALLGYMTSEADSLAARKPLRESDDWAARRARQIRKGMATVRTWTADDFTGDWSHMTVSAGKLRFRIVRIER